MATVTEMLRAPFGMIFTLHLQSSSADTGGSYRGK
jgi:hypothetical protein